MKYVGLTFFILSQIWSNNVLAKIKPVPKPNGQSYLVPSPAKVFGIDPAEVGDIGSWSRETMRLAREKRFYVLTNHWGESDQFHRGIYLPLTADLNTPEVISFVSALAKHKINLVTIYKLQNHTFNKLAAIAFGIFGNESEFGSNFKYNLKELTALGISIGQNAVSIGKGLEAQGGITSLISNKTLMYLLTKQSHLIFQDLKIKGDQMIHSRGPTQIKFIPDRLKQYYPGFSPDHLKDPGNAAIATIANLAEDMLIIKELRRKYPEKYSYITDENIFDYLPYYYMGSSWRLALDPTSAEGAGLVNNFYIQRIRMNMRKLMIMEQVD